MKVKNIQRKNCQDRSLKKRVMAMQKSEPVPGDVTFRCRKCNEEVCQAHNIRRVKETYHVIISSDVRDSKVEILSLIALEDNFCFEIFSTKSQSCLQSRDPFGQCHRSKALARPDF